MNLSKTTVSVCLSGSAGKYKIKPDTIERVKTYAEALGYIPNHLARKLTKPAIAPVGLIISQDSSSEKSLFPMHKAIRMLIDNNREFIMQSFLPTCIADVIAMLKGMNVRDVILFGLFSETPDVERSHKETVSKFYADQKKLGSLLKDMRLFTVDYAFPIPENSSLINIYRYGTNRDTLYSKLLTLLFHAGKNPVVCDEICIKPNVRAYLRQRGFDIDDSHILRTRSNELANHFEAGMHFAAEIIRLIKKDGIRTVVVHNDNVAAGLITELTGRGYAVPDDVMVIGFNNVEAAPHFKVPLTTIGLPVIENTMTVMESILHDKEIPRSCESECRIIWRESAKL